MKMKSLMGLLDGGSDWIWCVVLGSVMVVCGGRKLGRSENGNRKEVAEWMPRHGLPRQTLGPLPCQHCSLN